MKELRESLLGDLEAYQTLVEEIDQIADIALWIYENCQGKLILSGIGKSGLIAKKIASTLCSVGTEALFIHPVEALHGDLGLVNSQDLFIGFSNSGETDELLTLLHIVNKRSIPSLAITSARDSTLARFSSRFFAYKYEKESCPLGLAPTTSTTLTLIVGDMLAIELMRLKNIKSKDFAFNHPSGSLGKRLLTRVSDCYVPITKTNTYSVNILLFEILLEKSLTEYGLILVQKNQEIVGVFTDGDLRRILEINGKLALDFDLGRVCTYSPIYISKDETMEAAKESFEKHNVNTLLVEDNNKIIGILRK